ncbi:type I pullulanase [Helicovermis profundi]|uniref:Glycosyl hydrolase family 13 catalytic domain-containing protein n=1 Tax=Helicovermis profundi TaxID=3065157 RepID=A0AAU9EAJ1_9FIRM|nr:hypothetical protein HLPR_06400 [Clostridia bacterium S502]
MNKIEINKEMLKETYGVSFVKGTTIFRVFSPSSKSIEICIYNNHNDVRRKVKKFTRNENGIWTIKFNENLEGKYYTYLVDDTYEVIDPYVHSTNANSTKGMIIDASNVNPSGFMDHEVPKTLKPTESIIYELHIKDFSMDCTKEFKNNGKYLAFTEEGLKCEGEKIGIDHLIELGITHVHLLPVYDFLTVNDYKECDYNWGYDPYLFNSLEGSYSTNPEDGKNRIIEFKKMIMALHKANIRVILDVVYNHTYFSKTSNFHRLMPYLFHRFDKEGNFTNGSGCGCELNTENEFVRKFIIDSLKFWLNTYKIDGFRFDLFALYDVETVKLIENELNNIRDGILLYGEPWTGGLSSLSHEKQFIKGMQKGSKVALFNDDFRNEIKGKNGGISSGFVGSLNFDKNKIFAGCFGSIHFDENIFGYTQNASETINYVSCHDNLILMDKISKCYPKTNFEEKQNMNALSLTFVILSFGVPFIQAGTEFLRSKYGYHNTYNHSNLINKIDWNYKKNNRHVFDYIKELISFRKSQKVFSINEEEDLKKVIKIVKSEKHTIIYEISSFYQEDYEKILIVYNGSFEDKVIKLENDGYVMKIDGALYYEKSSKIKNGVLNLPKLSAVICVKES